MAENAPVKNVELPKWVIALAIGAPVALGVAGVWYYYRRKSKPTSGSSTASSKDAAEATSPSEAPSDLPEQGPLEKAQAAKSTGNKYFKGGKYEQAIKCYTEAIRICPTDKTMEISTFYQNRAAAYEQLKNYEGVIEDCTQALNLNKKYTKALFRRAKSYEKIGKRMEALYDVTATCIMEQFQNIASVQLADKLLKDLGKEKAQATYRDRAPVLPSSQFIKSYFASFTDDLISQPDPEPEHADSEESDDETEDKDSDSGVAPEPTGYLQARKCLFAMEYEHIIPLCTEEVEVEDSQYLAHALLLRATFYMLTGQAQLTLADLQRVIGMEDAHVKLRANAIVKRGSLLMQKGNSTEALSDFEVAIKIDSENSDVFHHRGQLHLLLERVEDALRDFDMCIKLKPDFVLAKAQHCYAVYRAAMAQRSPMQLQSAMKSFENIIEQHSDCAEAFALYAQALADQQMFDKADEMFQKGIDLEPDNPTTLVHKALLRLQWKGDVDNAVNMIRNALVLDEKCDFAYETLGTIEVQRGNLESAISLFDKAIQLARTEMEIAHLYSLCDAAKAQAHVAEIYGIKAPLAPQ